MLILSLATPIEACTTTKDSRIMNIDEGQDEIKKEIDTLMASLGIVFASSAIVQAQQLPAATVEKIEGLVTSICLRTYTGPGDCPGRRRQAGLEEWMLSSKSGARCARKGINVVSDCLGLARHWE